MKDRQLFHNECHLMVCVLRSLGKHNVQNFVPRNSGNEYGYELQKSVQNKIGNYSDDMQKNLKRRISNHNPIIEVQKALLVVMYKSIYYMV